MQLEFWKDELHKRWVSFLLAALFTALLFWLNSQKYQALTLQSPDIDQFSQAIWNTLHGRFLFTTVTNQSILAFHFSPYLSLLSPLLLIWSDVRILFLAQTVSVAATGVILYRIVEDRHRTLAPWFLLAFYLNASLHTVSLYELRRVTFAMPFIALMFYGLLKNRKGPLLVGIVFSLLIKEDLGLIVAMVGLYLVLFKRDWKWGIPITVLGLAWSASMLLWIIPSLRGGDYNQLRYFANWGNSPLEIVRTIFLNPFRVVSTIFDLNGLLALVRVLIPLAIVLPFLAPEFALIAFPFVVMMLLSGDRDMHTLSRWYMAPVLPILFGAVAALLNRLSERKARWVVVALLVASVVGYFVFSGGPLGGEYEPGRYEITDRARNAWDIIERVPEDAIVASQVAFITPLAQREHIYLYPWYAIGQENIEYFIMGRGFDSYPIPADEIDWEINNLIADPDIVVEEEVDGIYLLHQNGESLPAFEVSKVAEDAIKLERFEVAVADDNGFYRSIEKEPLAVSPGQLVRVTLYWEALAAPNAERTVSVRIEDTSGALVGQHDMLPVDGSRPTSWWQPGWRIRDVYYLTIEPNASLGPGSLDLVLYDSYTGERVRFEGDNEVLQLLDVFISEPSSQNSQNE
ncbi:MAG: DUF2079 domain-containing protein [Candidatus Promineifilaceae bacterium]